MIEKAHDLDKFFSQVHNDPRYHLELRTDLYLRSVFDALKHGASPICLDLAAAAEKTIGQANGRFFNEGNECVIRLMTPLDMRYEDAYARAYPFGRLVEGMLQPEMIWRL